MQIIKLYIVQLCVLQLIFHFKRQIAVEITNVD